MSESKYRPEYVRQARLLLELGATNEDLAAFFQVAVTTLYSWMQAHEEFGQAVVRAREHADNAVERSLYLRANGYSHPETKVFCFNGEIIEHTITKHLPPDVAACIYWLKNRQPERWRDTYDLNTKHDVARMSDDELRAIIEGRKTPA